MTVPTKSSGPEMVALSFANTMSVAASSKSNPFRLSSSRLVLDRLTDAASIFSVKASVSFMQMEETEGEIREYTRLTLVINSLKYICRKDATYLCEA